MQKGLIAVAMVIFVRIQVAREEIQPRKYVSN